jgi:hypothetical protein
MYPFALDKHKGSAGSQTSRNTPGGGARSMLIILNILQTTHGGIETSYNSSLHAVYLQGAWTGARKCERSSHGNPGYIADLQDGMGTIYCARITPENP